MFEHDRDETCLALMNQLNNGLTSFKMTLFQQALGSASFSSKENKILKLFVDNKVHEFLKPAARNNLIAYLDSESPGMKFKKKVLKMSI